MEILGPSSFLNKKPRLQRGFNLLLSTTTLSFAFPMSFQLSHYFPYTLLVGRKYPEARSLQTLELNNQTGETDALPASTFSAQV